VTVATDRPTFAAWLRAVVVRFRDWRACRRIRKLCQGDPDARKSFRWITAKEIWPELWWVAQRDPIQFVALAHYHISRQPWPWDAGDAWANETANPEKWARLAQAGLIKEAL
jgi:hypothetical protein